MNADMTGKASVRMAHRHSGFTLVELAIAMFIIALLLGSILVPLATQVEQRQISETQKTMDEIKEALIGFALANSYLPCPDTTGDGISDPAGPGACTNAEGFLPWVTLNVGQADVWGNRFRYRVTPEFTNTPATPCVLGDGRMGLCDTGNITINTRDAAKNIQALATTAIAVVISHGRNGYGATSAAGVAKPAPPAANADETTNANPPGTTFVSRTPTTVSAACSDGPPTTQPHCEFDDIVVWISQFTLFNRMVAAGRLP
jgi:prepilin-type N-terminal cleavage/methylation domain-containing protein